MEYDADNRLVKTECYDKNLTRTQLIEYFYDALGRLVRKVVIDEAGTTTETTYVWAGTVLSTGGTTRPLIRASAAAMSPATSELDAPSATLSLAAIS